MRARANIRASAMNDEPARKLVRVCNNHERCGGLANYPYDTCCGPCAWNRTWIDGRTGQRRRHTWECTRRQQQQTKPRAYVSLLHGHDDVWFLYAMMLGKKLQHLSGDSCHAPDRVLMISHHWVKDSERCDLLLQVWTWIKPVQLIHASHATKSRRHEAVFTKLHALTLPYERILFLDLDTIPLRKLDKLFEVSAPAGVLHDAHIGPIEDGMPISRPNDNSWCVNAGVLRLDPLPDATERVNLLHTWVEMIGNIKEAHYLPEQYFISRHFEGWQHLQPKWNFEIGAPLELPRYITTVARMKQEMQEKSLLYHQWHRQNIAEMNVLHFSGEGVQPWRYAACSPCEAYRLARDHWWYRDPKRIIATALYEWVLVLSELKLSVTDMPRKCQVLFDNILQTVTDQAWNAWYPEESLNSWCHHCHKCRNDVRWTDVSSIGCHSTGEAWLCEDCMVGYIMY